MKIKLFIAIVAMHQLAQGVTCVLTDKNRAALKRENGTFYEYDFSPSFLNLDVTCNLKNAPQALKEEAQGLAINSVNKSVLGLHARVHTVRKTVKRVTRAKQTVSNEINAQKDTDSQDTDAQESNTSVDNSEDATPTPVTQRPSSRTNRRTSRGTARTTTRSRRNTNSNRTN